MEKAWDHLEANPTINLHNNGILVFNKFYVSCHQCHPSGSLWTSSAHWAISLFQSRASTVLKKSLFLIAGGLKEHIAHGGALQTRAGHCSPHQQSSSGNRMIQSLARCLSPLRKGTTCSKETQIKICFLLFFPSPLHSGAPWYSPLFVLHPRCVGLVFIYLNFNCLFLLLLLSLCH